MSLPARFRRQQSVFLLSSLTAFLFLSCSLPAFLEGASGSSSDSNRVRLSLSASLSADPPEEKALARTVTPLFSIDEIATLSLVCKSEAGAVLAFPATGAYEKTAEKSALAVLNEGLSTAHFEQASYTFTLTATLAGAVYEGTVTAELSAGANSVSIPLQVAGSSPGGFSLTLAYSGAATRAVGSLCSVTDGSPLRGETELSLMAGDVGGTVSYGIQSSDEAAPEAGSYRIVIQFYGGDDGDILLNTYRELVRIAPGLTSTASRSLDLNEVYTITYYDVQGDGSIREIDGSDVTFVGSAPLQFSRKSAFTLPQPVKSGRTFVGWYTDSALSEGNEITSLEAGQTSSLCVYAKWQLYASLSDGNGEISVFSKAETVSGLQSASGNLILTLYEPVTAGDLGKATESDSIIWGIKNTGAVSLSLQVDEAVQIALPADSSSLFDSCVRLTSVDLGEFDTSAVTDMSGMFSGCVSLTSLDLSNFTTAAVTDMAGMFASCSALTTITVSPDFVTTAVTSSSGMFSSCSSLVGGAGTAYSASYTDASYACIDGGPAAPGYFTAFPTNLYVSNSGNDETGDGSASAPYATISQAVSHINAADRPTLPWTVHVSGSLNNTALEIDSLAAAALTIQAATGSASDVLSGKSSAPVVSLAVDVPVTIADLTIQSGDIGISASGQGSLTVTGCMVSMNQTCGIQVTGGGEVTIADSTIGGEGSGNGNTAVNGGGISVSQASTVTICDSSIFGNSATSHGGGIYNEGKLTLSNTCVGQDSATGSADNSSYANKAGGSGGGIYNSGILLLDGASRVSYNYAAASEDAGGGIWTSGSITLSEDSSVSCNGAAGSGGGIFVQGSGSVIMSGGEISGNSGKTNGGGVYLDFGSSMYMTGGVISGNAVTTNHGGGVYNAGSFFMSGSAVIGDSSADSPAAAGSCSNYTGSTGYGGGIYTTGSLYLGYTDAESPAAFSGGIYYNYGGYQGGGIYSAESGIIKMSGGSVACNGSHSDGGGIRLGGSADAFEMTGGAIRKNLANFDTGSGGGGIYAGGASSSIRLSGTAEISGNSAWRGGGIYNNGRPVIMSDSASITSNQATYSGDGGGGIFMQNESSIALSGAAEISGNSASEGGGIYASAGSVYLGYTAFSASSVDTGFTGGIKNNIAEGGSGGGIAASAGSVVIMMSGGTVSGNSASGWGGGLMAGGSSVFTMSGGTVSGNSCDVDGGAAYIDSNASMIMTGGLVTANVAQNHGSAICPEGDLIMSGSSRIADDNDVFLNTGYYISLGGSLTASTPVATITPADYVLDTLLLKDAEDAAGAVAANYGKFAVTDDGSGPWGIGSGGLLQKNVSGGISLSAPVYSSDDLELSAVAASDGSSFVFTAKSGYSSYVWTVNGTSVSSSEASLTVGMEDLAVGSNSLLLICTDSSGGIHSASLTVTRSQ